MRPAWQVAGDEREIAWRSSESQPPPNKRMQPTANSIVLLRETWINSRLCARRLMRSVMSPLHAESIMISAAPELNAVEIVRIMRATG